MAVNCSTQRLLLGRRLKWPLCCQSAYLVVEEVNGVLVEPEGEGFEEGNVVGHDLLIGEVELVNDDRVDVIVGEEVIWNKFNLKFMKVQNYCQLGPIL